MHDTRKTPGRAARGCTALSVASDLRTKITGGEFPVGKFMPPVRELAGEFGAATVTVNRALKMLAGEGLVVAQPRHGYRVCPGAGDPDRGLPVAYVNSSRHEVGGGRDEFHRALLLEFQSVSSARGWSLLTIDADSMNPVQAAEQIAAANCCGVVSNTARGELWQQLRALGVATVLVDAWTAEDDLDCVLQDGFRGGLQACKHLLERGHTEMAWIGPELAIDNAQILERYSGAAAAMKELGRPFTTEVTAPLGDQAAAIAAARNLLKRKKRPKAILALWQDMSTAIAKAASELGLVVGRDFEMVGWSTEEQYDSGFAPLFPTGNRPAAITWSIWRMADAAVARLKQRRAERKLQALVLRIPTTLRSGDK